jgi:hypothetical protein
VALKWHANLKAAQILTPDSIAARRAIMPTASSLLTPRLALNIPAACTAGFSRRLC